MVSAYLDEGAAKLIDPSNAGAYKAYVQSYFEVWGCR
jgi:hypothetical protein